MRSWLRAVAVVSVHCAALAVLCYGAYVGFYALRDYVMGALRIRSTDAELWIGFGFLALAVFVSAVAMVRDWSSGGTRIECSAWRVGSRGDTVRCEGNHTLNGTHEGKDILGKRMRWVS